MKVVKSRDLFIIPRLSRPRPLFHDLDAPQDLDQGLEIISLAAGLMSEVVLHMHVCVCVQVQYLARLRMDLDVANRRLETADEEKCKLIQERDEVHTQKHPDLYSAKIVQHRHHF